MRGGLRRPWYEDMGAGDDAWLVAQLCMLRSSQLRCPGMLC